MKFCSHCGKEIMDEAVVCTNCGCSVEGKQPSKQQDEHAKSQATAAIMIIAAIALILGAIIAAIIQYNSI